MKYRPQSVVRLITALQMLPGVGPRTAQRMAESVLSMPVEDARELANAIANVKKHIKICSQCHTYTEEDPCPICSDPDRDRAFLCVVQTPDDVEAFEKARGHSGIYHVLRGVLNPSKGIGPERLTINSLLNRVEKEGVREVLVALDTSFEGEVTATYISEKLTPLGIKVTRPAMGIPMGADLDYLDGETIKRAFGARREI